MSMKKVWKIARPRATWNGVHVYAGSTLIGYYSTVRLLAELASDEDRILSVDMTVAEARNLGLSLLVMARDVEAKNQDAAVISATGELQCPFCGLGFGTDMKALGEHAKVCRLDSTDRSDRKVASA